MSAVVLRGLLNIGFAVKICLVPHFWGWKKSLRPYRGLALANGLEWTSFHEAIGAIVRHVSTRHNLIFKKY